MRQGRPFVGPAGQLLDACLQEAGIDRSEINIANIVGVQPRANEFKAHSEETIAFGRILLMRTVKELQPSLIVTFGNEAAHTFVEGWPTRGGHGVKYATGIEARRGYFWIWEGVKVLTTVHPSFALRSWTPWRILLKYDLERAREHEAVPVEELRPKREVIVVA